ncbi:MAG: 3-ketoacyl-ACP reductase [Clostridiales bacterium]|nr:3-ketoacyl-ACP reductase [Clostridiales bacterium]
MKKTALVTGGGRGIGLAVALQLAEDGFNIAIMGTHEESYYKDNLKSLKEGGAIYVQGDTTSASDRKRFVESATSAFGGIHVLVNNAGVAPKSRSDLLNMTEESFDRVVGVNTKGTLFMTQLVAKQMLTQPFFGKKRGTIINISSCSAEVSSINRGEYCVSKAGLSMLTTLFADRLAPEGILVHEIRPGIIETDMTSAVKGKYDALLKNGTFLIERWGTPEDVAKAVSAFAGDLFLYTTGNHVDVDGGFHVKRL